MCEIWKTHFASIKGLSQTLLEARDMLPVLSGFRQAAPYSISESLLMQESYETPNGP